MILAGVLLVSVAQAATPAQDTSACFETASRTVTPATVQLCLGEKESKLADAAPRDSGERIRHLLLGADYYRDAADLGDAEIKVRALEALSSLYDAQHLANPAQMELVLQELVGAAPTEPRFLYALAKVQEERGFIEAAEVSLLAARQRWPDDVEPFRHLAQFYARRATAMFATTAPPAEEQLPGTPDDNGVYQVGGSVEPPRRTEILRYPEVARAAGIEGQVQVEVIVDETGSVTDARVVRSVPFLDDAALAAVRQWRFEPAQANGRSVPVRMTVTVNFAP